MKRTWFLILTFFLTSIYLGKSQSTDSFEKVLAHSSGNKRIELLLKFADSTLNQDPAKSLEYGLKALVVSKHIKSQESEAASLLSMGVSSVKNNSFENGIRYLQRALALYEKLGRNEDIGKVNLVFGTIYSDENNYELSHNFILKAISAYQVSDRSVSLLKAYLQMAMLTLNYGRIKESNKYGQLAYTLALSLYNKRHQGTAELLIKAGITLANSQKGLREYALAGETLQQVYAVSEELRDTLKMVSLLIQKSNLLFAQQNYTQASGPLDTAFALASKPNFVKELARVYASEGDIFFVKKNYAKALERYEKASELFAKEKSYRDLVNTYVLSSRIMNAEGNTKRALQLLNHSLEISKKNNLNQTVSEIYLSLSLVYEKEGKFPQALEFHKLWSEIRDSIYSEQSGDKLARLQMLYEISQKDQENKILRQNSEIQRLQIAHSQFQRLYLILAITAVIFLFLILFLRYRSKMKEVKQQRENEHRITELNKNLERRLVEELRKQEQQQELLAQKSKLESLGTLAAGIAHEINQPLGGISMGLDNIQLKLLEGHLSNDYLNKKIDSLFKHVDRIKKIIEHTRTFSRSQRQVLFGKINVNEVVSNALLMISAQMEEHAIDLEVVLGTIDGFVLGDAYRIEQVVLNLLSNAIHAVEERERADVKGYVKSVKIQTYMEEGVAVVVVWDNGIGIPHEHLDKIFDPFFTTKKEDKGTGLGLSITYGIVKDMLGELWVESKPNEYTRMRVMLPISS
ncbi:MAG TPA: ATP-binding protein [Williamwhitmania sp.]|nr:ATP-binding protein [Williamwhitmania sp.]